MSFKKGDRVIDLTGTWGEGVVWDDAPGYDNSLGKNVLKIRWFKHDYIGTGFHGIPPSMLAPVKDHYVKQFIHDNCM